MTKPPRIFQYLFDMMIHAIAVVVAAVLTDPAVKEAIANVIVSGMINFVRQPNLDEHLLFANQTLGRTRDHMASKAGQDFPKVVGAFMKGMFQIAPQQNNNVIESSNSTSNNNHGSDKNKIDDTTSSSDQQTTSALTDEKKTSGHSIEDIGGRNNNKQQQDDATDEQTAASSEEGDETGFLTSLPTVLSR
ncbi:hypothetical protein MPSEU_000770600 [Mayamaea pseudoterrestris]|nr:hypothetical protein MPSEU_000770600 [Mayamaea pseudoterrestris]